MDRHCVKIGDGPSTWAVWENWARDEDSAKEAALQHAKVAFRVLTAARGRAQTLPKGVGVTKHAVSNQGWSNEIEVRAPLLAEAGLTLGAWEARAPWTLGDCLESAAAASRILAAMSLETTAESVKFEIGTRLVSHSNGSVTFSLSALADIGEDRADLAIADGLQLAVLATSVAATAVAGPDFGRLIATDIPASATLKASLRGRLALTHEKDLAAAAAFTKRFVT